MKPLLSALAVLEVVAFVLTLGYVVVALGSYVAFGPTIGDLRAARDAAIPAEARRAGEELLVEGRKSRVGDIRTSAAAAYVLPGGPGAFTEALTRSFAGHGWAVTWRAAISSNLLGACRGPLVANASVGTANALAVSGRTDAVLLELQVLPGVCPASAPPPRELVSLLVVASFVGFLSTATYARVAGLRGRGETLRRSGGIESALTAFAWVPYVLVALRLGPELEPPGWLAVVGMVLALGGIGFAIWSVLALGRHYDLELEVHEGHEIVRAGPYGLVRHPVYLGIALHSLGAVLATGNVLLAIGTLGVTLPLFYLRAVTEEGMLRAELGDAYGAYARSVPMLVPFGPR